MKTQSFKIGGVLMAIFISGIISVLFTETSLAQERNVKTYDLSVWQTNSSDTLQPSEPLSPDDLNSLVKFSGPDDAVVYIYRLPAILGAVVKWQILWNEAVIGKIKQNDYIVAHINTNNQIQKFSYTGYETKFNFTNILPQNYYFIEVKGVFLTFGPLNPNALAKIKSCKDVTDPGK